MKSVLERIESSKRPLLTTHVLPDGDGLGSQMALHFALKKLGKQSVVLNPSPTPAKFQGVDPRGEIRVYQGGQPLPPHDLVVVCDTNEMHMMGPLSAPLTAAAAPLLFLDHHVSAQSLGEGHLINEAFAATGELVFHLLKTLGVEIDGDMARALYVAILTDTGGFKYKRTSPATHRVVAELLERGVQPEAVHQSIFCRDSAAKVRLFGHCLERLQSSLGGRMVWLVVSREARERFGATVEDTESFVNSLGYLQGAELGLLFREEDDGRIKVSLRGLGSLPVVELALKYGGGGHRFAAGMRLSLPLKDAVDRVCADGARLLGG